MRILATDEGFQTRNAWRLIWGAVVLLIVGCVMFFCEARWMKIGGASALGGCQFILLFDSHRRGELRTNWGVARRAEHPRWFWIEFCFWCAMAVVFTSALMWHAVGASGAMVS